MAPKVDSKQPTVSQCRHLASQERPGQSAITATVQKNHQGPISRVLAVGAEFAPGSLNPKLLAPVLGPVDWSIAAASPSSSSPTPAAPRRGRSSGRQARHAACKPSTQVRHSQCKASLVEVNQAIKAWSRPEKRE